VTFQASSYEAKLASSRYTVRHVGQLGEDLIAYDNSGGLLTPTSSTTYEGFVATTNGFTDDMDLYGPIFGSDTGASYTDNYVWTSSGSPNPYQDCSLYSSMWSSSRFYPYHSRTCGDISDYVSIIAPDDSLVPALWALHILNAHHSATTSYTSSQALFYSGFSWSPLAVAQYIRNHFSIYDSNGNWVGIGSCGELVSYSLSCTPYLNPSSTKYGFGANTAVFLALETQLCSTYSQSSECSWADSAAKVLIQHQVSSSAQFNQDGLNYFRPQYKGGYFMNWNSQSAISPSSSFNIFGLFLGVGLNQEYQGVRPADTETTMVSIGSLCLYLHKVYATSC
jgi:hypothetical protein